jgi:hypothetical protein
MVGRFFVCICYGIVYIYAAELFPAVIRKSAMGVGVTFSRIGGFVSPFLADVVRRTTVAARESHSRMSFCNKIELRLYHSRAAN